VGGEGGWDATLHGGHGAPHVVAFPPGHTTGAPAAHPVMVHPCCPAVPCGHRSTTFAPAAAVTEQSSSRHENWHVLPGPQEHVPLAHVPSQLGFIPSHVTWHGPDAQSNWQAPPSAQAQSPSAQVPPS
jgi:hypothetical protein